MNRNVWRPHQKSNHSTSKGEKSSGISNKQISRNYLTSISEKSGTNNICSNFELTAKGTPDRDNWTGSLRQNYSAKIKRKWQETKNSGGK